MIHPISTAWLWRQRNSTRLGFLMQLLSRGLGGVLGLLWTRLLLSAMGTPLFGLFSSFQSVAALGGLGDLGLGGVVGIEVGRQLDRNVPQLRAFLAGARTLFLLLALLLGSTFLALSPWLPAWLKFSPIPGAGSLTALFMVGAAAVTLAALSSYAGNLNYACGNVVWPVIPMFFLSQAALLMHWLLARQQAPLWLQFIPYVAASVVALALTWSFVRLSHQAIAELFPLRLSWRFAGGLMERSFWAYLCALGNLIYMITDRLLINAGFGPEQVPRYQQNNKLCELVFFAVVAASYMAMPKIAQWLSSPAVEDRVRAKNEASRLNRFQIFLGCAAALGYLFINDLFMRVWLGPDFLAPIWWQAAFAANLAMTAGADVSVQLAGRLSDRGLRLAGATIGLTALLNLALSLVSMKLGSITGIALATTLAQTLLSLVLSRFVCRQLDLKWLPWIARNCVLPLAVVSVAAALRWWLPLDSWGHAALLAVAYAAMLMGISRLSGLDVPFVRDEVRRLKAIFKT